MADLLVVGALLRIIVLLSASHIKQQAAKCRLDMLYLVAALHVVQVMCRQRQHVDLVELFHAHTFHGAQYPCHNSRLHSRTY